MSTCSLVALFVFVLMLGHLDQPSQALGPFVRWMYVLSVLFFSEVDCLECVFMEMGQRAKP